MLITRTSHFFNITRTLELNVTQEQLDNYAKGELAQKVFPSLSPEEREFIISGMISEEWDYLFT